MDIVTLVVTLRHRPELSENIDLSAVSSSQFLFLFLSFSLFPSVLSFILFVTVGFQWRSVLPWRVEASADSASSLLSSHLPLLYFIFSVCAHGPVSRQ